jgi:hypothetical protein
MTLLSLFPESIKYDVLHPVTKEPTGLTLDLVGTDNDDVYQAQLDVVKAQSANGAKAPIAIALSVEFRIKVATACIVGWTITSDEWNKVFEKLGYTDAAYSSEKALALVSQKSAGWIRTQIEEAIEDRTRFFQTVSNE